MIDFSKVKKLSIPEGIVKEIRRAADSVLLWKSGYKNWVRYSTEADGVTIYNGGLGYKNGYRIRSGGAETAHGSASHTGFIPAVGQDDVRLSGYDIKREDNANAINVYDANHTNIGQIVANSSWSYGVFDGNLINWDDVILEKDNVYKWTIPDGYGIAYIRVTGYTGNDGTKMIVTVNEEITA